MRTERISPEETSLIAYDDYCDIRRDRELDRLCEARRVVALDAADEGRQ